MWLGHNVVLVISENLHRPRQKCTLTQCSPVYLAQLMLSTICKVSTILQIFLQFEISITIIYWFHAPLNPAFNNRIAKNNVASSC